MCGRSGSTAGSGPQSMWTCGIGQRQQCAWDVPGMGGETHQDDTSADAIFHSLPATSATTKDKFTRKMFQKQKLKAKLIREGEKDFLKQNF